MLARNVWPTRLVSESTDSIMRITRLVPAGSVPLAATAGAERGVESSGRITFSGLRVAVSGLRRRTGRSGSVSASEFELESALRRVGPSLESELELEGALRRVGRLEDPPELRFELSYESPPNSMRMISETSMVRTLTPSSMRTVRAVPPRYVPLITRPFLSVMVSADAREAQSKAIPAIIRRIDIPLDFFTTLYDAWNGGRVYGGVAYPGGKPWDRQPVPGKLRRKLGVGRVMRRPHPAGQTGYSQPIPKAGIGGSPRFAARTPIGIFERVPGLRLSGTGGQMDGFGEAAAALQAFPIELPAQCGSGRAVMHVVVFQALACQVGAGIGDGSLGDEPAAQRDVAHQFAGQSAPAESPAGDGQHGRL